MFVVSKTDKEALEILVLLNIQISVMHYNRTRWGTIKNVEEVMRNDFVERIESPIDIEILKRTKLWKVCL